MKGGENMGFNSKNPLISPIVEGTPSSPIANTRGIYPKDDGWYDIDSSGNSDKLANLKELERLKYYGDKDIIPSLGSYFTVNSTGETITGLTGTGKTQTELVIPYEINGKKITSIGAYAFEFNMLITSIKLPNSITNIYNGAFAGCEELTSINIPNGITSIGEWTFHSCSSLISIELPNGIVSIGELAFYDCASLKSINIPNSVTSIGNDAFLVNAYDDEAGASYVTTVEAIHCEQGSYAETYAKANNIPIVYTAVKDIGSNVEIVNNLTTSDSTKALSANQGKVLNDTKVNVTAVLTKTNTTAFTPTANYHPATKKYVDDSISTSGGGDMLKTVYDTDDTGVVDNAEKLGGQLPSYYAKASTSVVVTLPNTVADWTTNTDENGETYYTKSFSNETFTSDGTPFVGVNYSDTISIARQQAEAYDSIDRVKVADGTAVFYCFNDIPSVSLDIQIKMVY